jgi:DNA modification methylase
MSRVETIGDCTLYLGDCRDILPTLGPVDAVVTDPPYGVSYETGMGGKFKGVRIIGDESVALRDELLSMLPDVRAVVFGSWKAPKPEGTKQTLIWEKGDHVGMGDLSLPWRPNTEEIYIIGNGFAGHRGSSVLRINAPSPNFTPDKKRFHPTEKPVALMAALLEKTPGDVVLDPFMGSGTTGVACALTDRAFIGIEREPSYFDIAVRRIEAAYKQPRLFAEPVPAIVQERLFE